MGEDEQVDQARLAHIGGDELGSETYGIEKKSQIACRSRTETNLLGEDVAGQDMADGQCRRVE